MPAVAGIEVEALYCGGTDVGPPIYSNSGDLDDPFRVTRWGGHCGTDGNATDLQTTLGQVIYGWGVPISANHSVADDFIVPVGQVWAVVEVVLYMYQAGTVTPSINSINYAITPYDLNGQPPPSWIGAVPAVAFHNTYRKADTNGQNEGCLRREQECIVSLLPPPLPLFPPGHYWLAWQAAGTAASGPWQTPVVIPGLPGKAGANGLHSAAGGNYIPATDAGVPQDFIFVLRGFVQYGAGDGDLNCDFAIDAFDIDPFVLALTNPAGYQQQYPNCSRMNADLNDDGVVNAFDIDPFVVCLTGGNC